MSTLHKHLCNKGKKTKGLLILSKKKGSQLLLVSLSLNQTTQIQTFM